MRKAKSGCDLRGEKQALDGGRHFPNGVDEKFYWYTIKPA